MREHRKEVVLELASHDKTVGSYPLEGCIMVSIRRTFFPTGRRKFVRRRWFLPTGENEYGGTYEKLVQAAKQYFPECKEVSRWSAQDCMPHDGISLLEDFLFSHRICM